MRERTALYRLYDAAEVLLYVGIAGNPADRWNTHKADQSWWPQVTRKSVEWFDNRIEAAKAEALAIRAENPQMNKAIPNLDGQGGFRLASPRPKRSSPPRYRQLRVSHDLWSPFGDAVRNAEPELDRSKVIREFVRWYVGDTDDLPRRPEPPRGQRA